MQGQVWVQAEEGVFSRREASLTWCISAGLLMTSCLGRSRHVLTFENEMNKGEPAKISGMRLICKGRGGAQCVIVLVHIILDRFLG